MYGEKAKVHYENVKISGSAWDTDVVSAGGKYLAVNWQASGGGVSRSSPQFTDYEWRLGAVADDSRPSQSCLSSHRTLPRRHPDSQPSYPISYHWLEVTPDLCSIPPGHPLTTTSLSLVVRMERVSFSPPQSQVGN